LALEQLRAFRDGRSLEQLGAFERVGPDGYPLLSTSELAAEHRRIGALVPIRELEESAEAAELLQGDRGLRTRAYLALIERTFAYSANLSTARGFTYSSFFDYGPAATLMAMLFDGGVDAGELVEPTLDWFTSYRFIYYGIEPLLRILDFIAEQPNRAELTVRVREQLIAVHGQCRDLGRHGTMGENLETKVSALIGSGTWDVIAPCEVWTEAVTRAIEADARRRAAYLALLEHCRKASAARPSDKWLNVARTKLEAVGREEFRAALLGWLGLVDAARRRPLVGPSWENVDERQRMHDGNAVVLRGLLWLAPELADAELARAVGKVAVSAYRKARGIGPRAPKVGNACVYALGRMNTLDAVGQLALLKTRVKTASAQKEIEKAFTAAAEALGLPRDQIEEMAVPTYGMDEVGVRRESFADGEFVGELRVDGREVGLHWSARDGKPQKSVPAKVKSEHKEELKELQTAVKDVAAMLPAQADRLDSMLLSGKRWLLEVFRERYLDHPLVATIARRLIWSFKDGDQREASGIFHDGRLVDAADHPIELSGRAEVELWHPIARSVDEVSAWRGCLERHEIRQPFKQAHREVYVLTDAERATRTYSNRFASHVLRQHQFNALCANRGWRNKLRLMVDDSYPPAFRELPAWGLRAEFWIEGIGDDYGTDTADSGAYLRVASDQVRFYRTEAAHNDAHAGGGGYTSSAAGPGNDGVNLPLALEGIPPLVFSEIMRDVDLFVGVASVGNDPTWEDGGPEGRFRAYWQSYSFGELGETAKTRRAVLERLVPRLKIADRCSFSERFLVVRGDLRTYKIHLGSGNILMEPNDQYLCIVKERSSDKSAGSGPVFLPFEGDAMLSLILSKAFLLAADRKISDPTITRQIVG
jgi:hypothetical protein